MNKEFKNMNIIPLKEDVEVNWYCDYALKALNLSNYIFENCNDFCACDNVHIVVSEQFLNGDIKLDVEEHEITNMISELKDEGINVMYALYGAGSKHIDCLVGFVYEEL